MGAYAMKVSPLSRQETLMNTVAQSCHGSNKGALGACQPPSAGNLDSVVNRKCQPDSERKYGNGKQEMEGIHQQTRLRNLSPVNLSEVPPTDAQHDHNRATDETQKERNPPAVTLQSGLYVCLHIMCMYCCAMTITDQLMHGH
jgi:hypothetical protein